MQLYPLFYVKAFRQIVNLSQAASQSVSQSVGQLVLYNSDMFQTTDCTAERLSSRECTSQWLVSISLIK